MYKRHYDVITWLLQLTQYEHDLYLFYEFEISYTNCIKEVKGTLFQQKEKEYQGNQT